MSHTADSRISQFPKILCQKMAHLKTGIHWILMSQSIIPVRLVPKSKPKFPAIIIPWENPLFWYFILLSDLPLYFSVGKICTVSKSCNFSRKFPYYHWHLSSCVWLGFPYDRDPFRISPLLMSTRAWLALAPLPASSALQPLTDLTE